MPRLGNQHQLGPGYAGGQQLGVARRHQAVLGPAQGQGGRGYVRQAVIGVKGLDRLPLPGHDLGRGLVGRGHLGVALDHLGPLSQGLGREQGLAPLHLLGQALAGHQLVEQLHGLGRGHDLVFAPAVGGGEHQAADQAGPAQGQLLGDHAAHGQAQHMGPRRPGRSQHRRRIPGHVLDGAGPPRVRGAAYALVVKDNHLILLAEHRNLLVPMLQVGADAPDQQQGVARAMGLVIQNIAVPLDLGHGTSLSLRVITFLPAPAPGYRGSRGARARTMGSSTEVFCVPMVSLTVSSSLQRPGGAPLRLTVMLRKYSRKKWWDSVVIFMKSFLENKCLPPTSYRATSMARPSWNLPPAC
eukprot:TRINITY_DN5218_c0_g1_i1.p2 TRINITY_DN5218_c0_g1~~TRINITY_DN5218_c0_g1_i1.p2  ORF type:complete len:355 (-),score=110.79 TRINITY_DN5218_c0_g1_i1:269-1333(-)